ncbi:MAG: hypothetical protein K8W52_24080 [Deltaproteobacteria bacterium]|nr:hypothetical protein [Deltaproteobacteria bacterium]
MRSTPRPIARTGLDEHVSRPRIDLLTVVRALGERLAARRTKPVAAASRALVTARRQRPWRPRFTRIVRD